MTLPDSATPGLRLAPPAVAGQPAATIDTPSLVLDLDVFERNLAQMQQAADKAGVHLRPHAKAHKCPAIALAQIARGAVGICCQKVSEALPFVQAGVTDIHISNEIAGTAKAALLAGMARHARLSVCVDDARQIGALAEAAGHAGSTIGVFVEIDVGQGRCGVADAPAALRLVQAIGAHARLEFRGLQAYHGGIQHVRDYASRRQAAADAAARTAAVVAELAEAGVACPTVTGGGSGSVEFDLASGVYTEIQPGSYIFMDADYGRNDYSGALRFEHSLFIASTVMSVAAATRPAPRVVLDAGLKSMAVDSGLPLVWGAAGPDQALAYVAANDEHGIVEPLTRAGASAASLPALGTQVLLVPGHCDPTLNLYDEIVGVRGQTVACLWPVAARGLSR
ncbi:DSD1 family PLP-dependent enzyme [Cupriavidus basilensis]|uniref:DSD1 family PLP-dependent enzyme n=1 Tax=Cupriavidus basilensis TaxID=68895 RepID=A0ABT6AYW3_9BURK|nr:DSD1 family PLP-dependent enzyme [Cupriavidus basilensis]MDF3837805.1 DSD1 family PLP-dependent enzyme [Cupriavidus basilensis]